jgi:serine/threonine-protein kinase
MPKPNDRIGPYTLVRKLGRGTFGVVWLAEKRTALAVTKIALKLPNDDDIDLECIKREAAVWVEASGHPNVLPIIDADIYGEHVVIASEYAPDGSLADWLRRYGGKAPSVEAAVEMTAGILDGLTHLHARRIIHRDLKPDNILLQGKTPRLVDFGLARVLKTTAQSSNTSGTYAYMPPEAFDGKRSVQTDVWAVGVILHQLLTGRLPYPQMDNASLIGAILTREPEMPPSSVPEQLRKVIKQSLQRRLEQRYKSASEMRQALSYASQPAPQVIREEKTRVLPAKVLPVTDIVLPATTNPIAIREAQERVLPLPTVKFTGARSNKTGGWLPGIIGAILLIAGVFCPLIGIELSGLSMSVSYLGSSGGRSWDGIVLLLCGITALILAALRKSRLMLMPGILSLAIITYTYLSFKSRFAEATAQSGAARETMENAVSIKWGWFVLLLGGLIVTVAGLMKNAPTPANMNRGATPPPPYTPGR